MKLFHVVLMLYVLALVPLAASGGGQQAQQAVANSASIVTAPGQLPIVTQPITLTLGISQSPNVNDYDNTYLTKYLEEKTGIKINFQFFSATGADANTQFELMVASNERLPDIKIGANDWATYGDNGIFLDLNPFIEKWGYFYNEALAGLSPEIQNLIRIKASAASGKQYAFPVTLPNGVNRNIGHNSINKVWLDKLGLKMPTTTEEFYNTMIAFRDRDPNGNGQKDEIPWICGEGQYDSEPLAFLINAFVYYPGRDQNEALLNVTNGKLWTPWTTEEYREALRFANRLFNEGLLTSSTFTLTSAEMIAICSYHEGEFNRIGFISAHPAQVFVPETPAVYDYINQVSLTGPAGVNYAPQTAYEVTPNAFITRDSAYPEAAFRWLELTAEPETLMTLRYGEKDVDWRWVDPSEGLVSVIGTPARYQEFNMLWGVPQNKHWSNSYAGIFPFSTNELRVKDPEGTWNAARWSIYEGLYINDGKDAPEKVEQLNYTNAEENSIREIRASLNTYRTESLALFVTGAMSLDRDWDTYINTLNQIGLQRYMQVAQTAYTRTANGGR